MTVGGHNWVMIRVRRKELVDNRDKVVQQPFAKFLWRAKSFSNWNIEATRGLPDAALKHGHPTPWSPVVDGGTAHGRRDRRRIASPEIESCERALSRIPQKTMNDF
jgi:hypothetical protein